MGTHGDSAISDDALLARIVLRLKEHYRPERIYLFGSRARNDHRADSDFDLLLVVPDDVSEERRNERLAGALLWDAGRGADVVIYTRSRFERKLTVAATLPATVAREGKFILS